MKLVLGFSLLILLTGLAGCYHVARQNSGYQFPPAQNEGEHVN